MLKHNERLCMNACGRYIRREALNGEVWTLHDEIGELSALIVHSGNGLMPILHVRNFPPPQFLCGLFGKIPVNSLQGKEDDVIRMEAEMEKMGLFASEKIDFDVMCIDRQPDTVQYAGPAGLVIRKPQLSDMESLVALHAAYEKEEVLSSGKELNLSVSRMNTQKIFANQQMLVAELDGRLVGKINTNAVTFTRYQVGGVYVHPEYRGMRIAQKMAGEFIADLVSQGRGISLFVKKSNAAARSVYLNIGFETIGDYRINYYNKG